MKHLRIPFLTLLLIYCALQFRSFLLEDYSSEYQIYKKTDIQKLTQEHPSMPAWRFQFISTIINSVDSERIDTIFIAHENYNDEAIETLSKYYSQKHTFLFTDTTQNIFFKDSSFCVSNWLKNRYVAKWNVEQNKIYVKYESSRF